MAEGVKIGLEVHIYPRTVSKMYCSCSSDFLNAPPNSRICPVCSGQPGSKPMPPNRKCIEAGLMIAAALGMKAAGAPVRTLRKHYFYPDLPSNYQRTAEPMATGGSLHGFALREIHWEEDPGQYDMAKGRVDLNRSGVPLLELVTEPSMHRPQDARDALDDLLLLLQYLEIDRRELPFKVDTNVSVAGGQRVEVKNINSVNGVVRALEFEISRQSSLLEGGGRVEMETRHFDEIGERTVSMRYKETSEDYRYMADPDMLPVDLESVSAPWQENPFAILARMKDGGVREEDARVIISDRRLLAVYDSAAAVTGARFASVFVARDIVGELNFRKLPSGFIDGALIGRLLPLASAVQGGRLSNSNASELLRSAFDGDDIAPELAKMEGVFAGRDAISAVADEVIASEKEAVARYRKGSSGSLNFLVGLCMKKLGGKAKAGEIIAVLRSRLDGEGDQEMK